MKVELSVKYHIFMRGDTWLVRLKQRDGEEWRKRHIVGACTTIAGAWELVREDLSRRQAKRMLAVLRGAPSRADGGRFHGADC